MAAGKTWQEKAENACSNCTKCKGNFPINPDEQIEDLESDAGDLFDDVREIILEQNAGFYFEIKDLTLFKLVLVWRETERQIKLMHELKMQAFLNGWFKK